MLGIELGLISSFLVFLAFFYLFSAVIAEKKKSPLKRSFIVFVLLYLGALFSELLLRLPFTAAYSETIAISGNICFVLTGLGYLGFTYRIFYRKNDWIFGLFATLAICSIFLSFLPGAFVYKQQGAHVLVMPSGTLAFSMLFSLVGPVCYAIVILLTKMRQKGGNEAQRGLATMFLKGTGVSILLGVVAVGIIPLLFPRLIEIFEFTSLSALSITIFLYIALKRYHFHYIDLSEIENVSKALFETVNEGVVIFNKVGEVAQINREAKNLLGEIECSADVETLIADYSFDATITARRTSLDSLEKEIPIIVSQSGIYGGGQFLGRILIMHDIDNEVRLERERETMRERIRQSEKLESLGQLAGGVAHDFNNQLTGIIGCAEFLQAEVGDAPELHNMIDMILKSAQSSADLTSKLLAFARKGKYLTKELDLHETVREVETLLKRTIDKRISIEMELTASHATVVGDKTQLQNALLNLALNACDAMDNEGGVLSFFSEELTAEEFLDMSEGTTSSSEHYLCISVSDTGTGMTEETRKHIFEPFFTTKGQGKGTGMGLAAVYGTVVNHHGTIVVNSILGKGTSFNLLLPLVEQKVGSLRGEVSEEELICNGHILLVDDEELILKVGRSILERKGFSVQTEDNGLDALEIIKESASSIDLVILDLIMPDLRGDEVHKHIRSISTDLPILIASGYSEEGVAHELLDDKATAFIQKPFKRDSLLKAVSAILRRAKLSKENS